MISEEELNDYIARTLGSRPPDFEGYPDPELARRVYDCVEAGLRRLNRVPSTAPFWERTNRRPTIYKLGDYVGWLVGEAGTDEGALEEWGSACEAAVRDQSESSFRWRFGICGPCAGSSGPASGSRS